MPVEIKELVIRMVGKQTTTQNTGNTSSNPNSTLDQDAVIAACVKEVLKILEKKQKR